VILAHDEPTIGVTVAVEAKPRPLIRKSEELHRFISFQTMGSKR
jgi:hypothetical protein